MCWVGGGGTLEKRGVLGMRRTYSVEGSGSLVVHVIQQGIRRTELFCFFLRRREDRGGLKWIVAGTGGDADRHHSQHASASRDLSQ